MALATTMVLLAIVVIIGIVVVHRLQRRIDAAIDRNLPDPRWY